MITYWLNWMGPINADWISKNGDQWSGGRIDVSGVEDEPFGFELSAPTMLSSDWVRFGAWLKDFSSPELLSLQELVAEYEKTNPTITWFKKD